MQRLYKVTVTGYMVADSADGARRATMTGNMDWDGVDVEAEEATGVPDHWDACLPFTQYSSIEEHPCFYWIDLTKQAKKDA